MVEQHHIGLHKESYKVNPREANTKSNKGDKMRRSFTSDVRSKTEQPRDFYLLGLHEFNLVLLGFLESFLGISALGLESLLQLSYPFYHIVATN